MKEDAYVILEHFAANAEEFALSEEGMMLMGKPELMPTTRLPWAYAEGSDFSQISYKERFWNQSHAWWATWKVTTKSA